MKKLKEVLTPSNGIFKYLSLRGNVPWEMESSLLDLRYLSKSGEKFVAPLIDLVVTTPQPSTDNLNTIADTILGLYLKKWTKLYETLSLEYNPIENYRMVETESGVGTTHTEGSSTNTSHMETSTSNDSTTDNMIFGFNSSSAKNSDQIIIDATGSSNSSGSGSSSDSSDGTTNTNRELTRSGNIGVTTSQQMIESERMMWEWNFFEVVFRDIDYLLTLQVYGGGV